MTGTRRGLLLRALLVGLFIVLATVQVARTAAVTAWVERRPVRAGAVYPEHPAVQRSLLMAEVGAAAALLRNPSPTTLQRLEQLTADAPLASEPFLVQAALAQRAGEHTRAEQLLLQARRRDPRSAAARFLLADLYFRTGRVIPGLAELTVLTRLVPGAIAQVAPALAAYAATPGALPQLKRIISVHPDLGSALLTQLAADPRNTELILAIAEASEQPEPPTAWQQLLLTKLIEQGAYRRAYAVWAQISGISERTTKGLFNPTFSQSKAAAPFNWSFGSGAGGVAEPSGDGLHVLYFGRDDVVFASQLLLLPPGRYRLEMKVAGQAGEGGEIAWRITCLPTKRQPLELALGGRASGDSVAGEFDISPDCRAQMLELKGVGKEFPESADFRISRLHLTRIAG